MEKLRQDIRKILSLTQSDPPASEACVAAISTFQQTHSLDLLRYQSSGDTILHCAARQGDHTTTAYLLQHFTPDCRNKDNKTPLHEACQFGRVGAARVLLTAGANINALKKADWTPLMLACTKLPEHPEQKRALVELLLLNKAVVNFQNKDGWTALHLATREGDLHLISTLCTHGADAEKKTNNGKTCLHIAALNQHADAFFLLHKIINNDDCLEVQNTQGDYPLHEAVLSNCLETVKVIAGLYKVKVKQNIEELLNKSGYNILHLAAFIGSLEIVKFCLQQGFDLHKLTKDNQNCLHLAIRSNMMEVYRLCLDLDVEGADNNARDKFGRTPNDYNISNSLTK